MTDHPTTDEMPQRIQLRRTKGWRMPPNTLKVDRSTRWGNPFVVGEAGVHTRRHAVHLYRSGAFDNAKLAAEAREFLRGKNLACWCPLPANPYEADECHATVLLEIANA